MSECLCDNLIDQTQCEIDYVLFKAGVEDMGPLRFRAAAAGIDWESYEFEKFQKDWIAKKATVK